MRLRRFIKPFAFPFTVGSLSKLAEAFLELYLPIYMSQLLDYGIPSGEKSYIIGLGIKMLAISLLGFGFAAICQYFASYTSQSTGTLIRSALMEKISSLSYTELDKFGTSTLTNRITTDVNYYQQAVAMTIRLVTRAPFVGIGALVMSMTIDKKITTIFLIIIPILVFFIYLFMKFSPKLFHKVRNSLDYFALIVREYLSGVRVIRAFANSKQETKKAAEAAGAICESSVKVGLFTAILEPTSSMVVNIGIILVIYFGASRVYNGHLTQGQLLALTAYATKILYALIQVALVSGLFTSAAVSSQRISEVLETESSVKYLVKNPVIKNNNDNCLELCNISFSYYVGNEKAEEKKVINNLSLQLKKSKTLGIVGITGSGKTTLINLIQRFYDVADGKIFFHGIPIQDYPMSELRQKIGIVPSVNVLFSGTIYDNLRMGCPSANESDVISALKTAQCWDFVSALPDGINSVIYEGGKNFSGGQKQRLTIARALVRKPELLILDDSLSALDYKTDLALRRALRTEYGDLSTIIVSQRITSVMGADQILVLDQGLSVGVGTHDSLIISCPPYKEIYDSQVENKNREGA